MTDEKTRLANRERQRKYREAHREEINQQRKERYNDRIAKGKCPRCGGKVKKGYTLCAECCEYQANLNRKYADLKKKSPAARKSATKAAPTKAASKTATKKPASKTAAAKSSPAKKSTAKPAKPKAAAKKTTTKKTAAKAKPKGKTKK